MHSGFPDLRDHMSMNMRKRYPGKGRTPESRRHRAHHRDLDRRRKKPFLFGAFTAADAMYAPVVLRFRTYEVKLPRAARAYCEAVLALPAMREWIAAAEREASRFRSSTCTSEGLRRRRRGARRAARPAGARTATTSWSARRPRRWSAQGYRPVGKDFPVFLHPQTHEEYALARTERKSGRGYKGFTVHASPDVTLEEDLRRRDLTINAMAQAPRTAR